MARKRHKEPQPGQPDFIPWNDALRRAHAEALTKSHAGHQCAPRAEALTEAAGYYAILGEHDHAEPLFKEALEIEEADPGRVHGYYASFLFDRGRAAEALDVIAQARRLDPDDPEVFHIIGETLLENDYAQRAARWFTAGIVRYHGALTSLSVDDLRDDYDLGMLAEGRQLARKQLRLAPDHIDEMVEECREARAAHG